MPDKGILLGVLLASATLVALSIWSIVKLLERNFLALFLLIPFSVTMSAFFVSVRYLLSGEE